MSQEPKENKEAVPIPSNLQPQTQSVSAEKALLRERIELIRSEIFSGPLPKPEILQGYNNIVPGSADRIIQMAEKQADHRMFLEKTVIAGDAKRADRGLICGTIVALCVLAGAVFVIYTGHDAAGIAVITADIAGLVSAFIYGTKSRRAERVQKAKIMKPPEPPDNLKGLIQKPPI